LAAQLRLSTPSPLQDSTIGRRGGKKGAGLQLLTLIIVRYSKETPGRNYATKKKKRKGGRKGEKQTVNSSTEIAINIVHSKERKKGRGGFHHHHLAPTI